MPRPKKQLYLGIDPGKSGGIAVIQGDEYDAWKMPPTERDLWNLLEGLREGSVSCLVEKVHAGPSMGSSAAFKFGFGCGTIQMALIGLEIPFDTVTPQKWQRELGLVVKGRGLGQGDTEKKNRNKAKAQQLFPELSITHAIADALLIAEYHRRTFK